MIATSTKLLAFLALLLLFSACKKEPVSNYIPSAEEGTWYHRLTRRKIFVNSSDTAKLDTLITLEKPSGRFTFSRGILSMLFLTGAATGIEGQEYYKIKGDTMILTSMDNPDRISRMHFQIIDDTLHLSEIDKPSEVTYEEIVDSSGTRVDTSRLYLEWMLLKK